LAVTVMARPLPQLRMLLEEADQGGVDFFQAFLLNDRRLR
jgi:hypothetical protein